MPVCLCVRMRRRVCVSLSVDTRVCGGRQEMDGVSFMLLTWSALTEVLQLSERDAVALCTHVSRVKYTYFTAFSG